MKGKRCQSRRCQTDQKDRGGDCHAPRHIPHRVRVQIPHAHAPMADGRLAVGVEACGIRSLRLKSEAGKYCFMISTESTTKSWAWW